MATRGLFRYSIMGSPLARFRAADFGPRREDIRQYVLLVELRATIIHRKRVPPKGMRRGVRARGMYASFFFCSGRPAVGSNSLFAMLTLKWEHALAPCRLVLPNKAYWIGMCVVAGGKYNLSLRRRPPHPLRPPTPTHTVNIAQLLCFLHGSTCVCARTGQRGRRMPRSPRSGISRSRAPVASGRSSPR